MNHFLKYTAIVCLAMASCKGNENNTEPGGDNGAVNTTPVANISYSVIKTYPHDTASFTQGLVVYKGQLYEGTGGSDQFPEGSKNSRLLKVDLKSGKALKSLALPGNYFGEGITILNDTVYQLTWQQKVVFVYTLPDFKKVKEFLINTEGWGITHNGRELIVSDGSSNLYYYNPSDFKLLRTQSVTVGGEYLDSINELEFIDGFVYANQWQRPYIHKIDPASGQVVGRVDLTQIWNHVKTLDSNIDPLDRVPNGIAYDADTKKIYVTGKKWPELYQIQLGR